MFWFWNRFNLALVQTCPLQPELNSSFWGRIKGFSCPRVLLLVVYVHVLMSQRTQTKAEEVGEESTLTFVVRHNWLLTGPDSHCLSNTQNTHNIKGTQNCFKYLGIEVTHTLPTTFRKNFIPLLDKCKQDMVRWGSLPLTVIGHVNLVKMLILPKFLYLFQNIPILIKKSFSKHLMESLFPSYEEINPAVLASRYSGNQNI